MNLDRNNYEDPTLGVIYDIRQTGCRYTNMADARLEAWLLGLSATATLDDLSEAVDRLLLQEYHPGSAVGWASA